MMADQKHLERIRLLSARFHELKGLRLALTGACITLVVGGYLLTEPAPTDTGSMVALLAAFVLLIPGMVWLGRYYDSTFGRQERKPSRHTLAFVVGFNIVAWTLNAAIPSIPPGGPTLGLVVMGSLWLAIRDWPYRGYYAGVAAAVVAAFAATASGGGPLAPNLTLGTLFLAVGASFVPVGLLDHLLLVRLMKETSAAQPERARS
jgi:hypothetical protein